MINPHNSPWKKPYRPQISDQMLYFRWKNIHKYLTTEPSVIEYNGILMFNDQFYLAKNSSKMRLKSHLDWCWYTPKTLADAIDNNSIEQYYELMLRDVRSDPNNWKDSDLEQTLKSYYAARIGRASLI